MVFIIYGCESCPIKKAERQRIDAFKLWCWRRPFRSPLENKEIKAVNPKRSQPWIFTRRTEAEAPTIWPPDAKSQFIGKDSDAGKDRRQKEKRVTEDKMVGWHHRFSGYELGQTLGDGEGQVGLACSSLWGHKELDTTWWLTSAKSLSASPLHSGKSPNFLDTFIRTLIINPLCTLPF